jgi:hypothetical protein
MSNRDDAEVAAAQLMAYTFQTGPACVRWRHAIQDGDGHGDTGEWHEAAVSEMVNAVSLRYSVFPEAVLVYQAEGFCRRFLNQGEPEWCDLAHAPTDKEGIL